MGFAQVDQAPLVQGRLGAARGSVLGAQGVRLTGLNSFHLDEGPDFAWLNIYRTLTAGRQLEITRERQPAALEVVPGGAQVRWEASGEVEAELSAFYAIVEGASAVDATFSAAVDAAYEGFELFIANYFTPYYTPHYALADNQTHPEDIFWYTKQWYGQGESESWARDAAAEALFRDGRWLSGHPLNWRRGPCYAFPLTIQEHRYGHAIVLMACPRECFGISGYNSYHNSQYFHLGGEDLKPGEGYSSTVRLVLLHEWDDLHATALACYREWVGEC